MVGLEEMHRLKISEIPRDGRPAAPAEEPVKFSLPPNNHTAGYSNLASLVSNRKLDVTGHQISLVSSVRVTWMILFQDSSKIMLHT